MNNPFDDVNPEDDPPLNVAPWDDLEEAEDGPFLNYCAWERWVAANEDYGDILAPLDADQRVALYDLFLKAVRGTRTL